MSSGKFLTSRSKTLFEAFTSFSAGIVLKNARSSFELVLLHPKISPRRKALLRASFVKAHGFVITPLSDMADENKPAKSQLVLITRQKMKLVTVLFVFLTKY